MASSLLCGLLAAGAAQALSEFGIEGMGVVSTPASELRASVSPDGQRIAWGSPDRQGGAGGADLWQAVLRGGRWQDARPLPVNSPGHDFDPMFSADGRWLYFASNREGGQGGDDLYRAAVLADGGFGPAANLGRGVNGAGDERAPAPGRDAIGDESGAAWLGDGATIVFARSHDATGQPIQLFVAQCDGQRYADTAPLELSFNSVDARTRGPAIDWNKPGELLVSGSAKAPKAGKLDIYRLKAPAVTGKPGCF